MKKVALWTFLSLSTLIAGDNSIKYEIEPVVGYNIFDSGSKMQDKFLYGIRATVYANEYYAYRVGYERADDVHYDNSEHYNEKSTDLHRVSGQILMRGEEEYNVTPYILLGGGYEILSDETRFDVSQGYIEGGIGFKYHALNRINLNLEGRVFKKFDTDDIDYMINLGLGYMFGSSFYEPELYQPSVLDQNPKSYKKAVENISLKKTTFEPLTENNQQSGYIFKEENKLLNHQVALSPSTNSDNMIYANQKNTIQKEYYVQMAAWSNSQNNKLLNRLENGGYPFDIKDAIRDDKQMQLVVVGPFESFSDAKLAYRDLKKIKRDAFITKL